VTGSSSTNVFGPRQDPGSTYAAAVPIFLQRALAGQPGFLPHFLPRSPHPRRQARQSAEEDRAERINHHVFRDPEALVEHILRVTAEVCRQLMASAVPDHTRRGLTVVPARDGRSFARDDKGSFWLCYLFIEGTTTYDTIKEPWTAHEAARAFGQFQRMLTDLPGPRLNETIPDFHNTPARLRRLQEAVAADQCGRLAEVGAEWNFTPPCIWWRVLRRSFRSFSARGAF